MKAFVVSVNGKRVCVAGVANIGVLDVHTVWCRTDSSETLELAIGGMDSTTDEQLEWDAPAIDVGDQITIKVVDVDSVDPESTREFFPVSPRDERM